MIRLAPVVATAVAAVALVTLVVAADASLPRQHLTHLWRNRLKFCGSALHSIPAWAKEPIRIIEGMVSKVSDGDTVQVQDALGTRVKVRLYGIDAPETEKRNRKTGRVSKPGQPYGEEAFLALGGKVGGQFVKVASTSHRQSAKIEKASIFRSLDGSTRF